MFFNISDGSAVDVDQLKSKVPHAARFVCEQLRKAGFQAYLVGGGVRDLLRGTEPLDWDVATAALPDEVIRLFKRTIPTGVRHGTVTVLERGQSIEVTTFRGEGAYLDGRRPAKVHFLAEIEADLERRDFTINAIAIDPMDGKVVDPFGGLKDLSAKVIRAVGDPLTRFREDGLRVLRAARFASVLGFEIESSTKSVISDSLDVFDRVAKERIHDELWKLMAGEWVTRGLTIAEETGLRSRILSELDALEMRERMFRYQACSGIARDPVLRLMALYQQIDANQQLNRDFVDSFADRMKCSNADRQRMLHLSSFVDALSDQNQLASVGEIRKFIARAGGENYLRDILSLYDLFRADASTIRAKVDEVMQRPFPKSLKELAIDGDALLTLSGRRPGAWVSELLKSLLEAVWFDKVKNDEQSLKEYALEILDRSET